MTVSESMALNQIERRKMVARLTSDGMTGVQIADYLSVDRRTVYRDRNRLGLSRPASKPLSADELARAKELAADGCPLNEIAETLNRSPSTIERYCRGMLYLRSDPLRRYRQLMKQLGLW